LTTNIFDQLSAAVVALNQAEVIRLAERVVRSEIDPAKAIEKGIVVGMEEVGRRFACHEFFVPEVLVASKVAQSGIVILQSAIKTLPIRHGTILLAVVKGDIHDLGKNIVRVMLETAGFNVIDLGKNVAVERILSEIEAKHIDLIALSTLMTTTMPLMADSVATVKNNFNSLPVMVGGAPLTDEFARSIGADWYGENAHAAVVGARKLLGISVEG